MGKGRLAENAVSTEGNAGFPRVTTVHLTIAAKIGWQSSGVYCNPGAVVTVTCTGGLWTHNPATGMHDWRGDGAHPHAPGEFMLPGAPEGCLLYAAGDNEPAEQFMGPTMVMKNNGKQLHFIINDDPKAGHGSGFGDNEGHVSLVITVASS